MPGADGAGAGKRALTVATVVSPLVRLRVRRLRHVHQNGHATASSTVFCPARLHSTGVDTCLDCPHIASVEKGAIVCAPPVSAHQARDLLAIARLGEDACVGDAMGCVVVSVHAELGMDAVARSLEEEGATVALVVDDAGRLVGLVAAEKTAWKAGPDRAREFRVPGQARPRSGASGCRR